MNAVINYFKSSAKIGWLQKGIAYRIYYYAEGYVSLKIKYNKK